MAGRAAGVHAIVGADSFLAEEALERVLTAALGPEREGALQALRGDETTWTRLVDAASMRSLFAERRAVVVRNADALRGEGEEVAGYLDDPTPGVSLVLLAAKPDRRRTVWKRVLERAEVVPADPLKGRALRGFVVERLRRRGLRVADDGVEELLERVGQDLRRLMGEIDKLEAFGAGRALTAEDVAGVLGRGMARPLYKLGDAMTERRAVDVLELVGELLEEGEDAPKIVGTLHRSLRQVRAALALSAARVPREVLAAKLLPPNMAFKLPALLEATRRWSEPDLAAALRALAQADRRLKTSVDPRIALAAAVAAACGGESGGGTTTSPRRPGR